VTISTLAVGAAPAIHRRTVPSVVVLGWREARRMILSPVFAVYAFLVLVNGVGVSFDASFDRAAFYEGLTYFLALYLGLMTYMSAHLVTSSARRTGAEAQLDATAMGTRWRSGGLCIGVIFGPGLLAVFLVGVLALLGNGIVSASGSAPMSSVELGQLALTVVGGGLFGVMWATWLRFPGSLPLGLVVLVIGTVALNSPAREPMGAWPWFMPYIASPGFFDGESWPLQGSQAWHAAYLVGLCALAVCATMLRHRGSGISAGMTVQAPPRPTSGSLTVSLAAFVPGLCRWPALATGMAAAWGLVAVVWHDDEISSAGGAAWTVRLALVLSSLGAVFALDDPSAGITSAAPETRRVLVPLRLGVVAAVVLTGVLPALLWLWEWLGDIEVAFGLAVEGAAVVSLVVALVLVMQRQLGISEPAQYVVLLVLGLYLASQLMAARWPMLVDPGPDWADAHWRWAAVLVMTLGVVVWQLRDPASPPMRRWLHR
jgi:hypothetical protein